MKKTNRFIALLTALVLVFSTLIGSTAFAAVNEDVVGTDFEEAVGKLKAVGVMQGYPDGTFLPNGEITRAEFAKIAVVALGLGDAAEASKGVTRFPDVASSHWAAGYVNLAANRGLINGYPDGTFKPEGKITNAEAITILCRLVGLGPVIDKEGTWPANYVGRAANEGILDGVNVAAGTNATRGLVAKMLVNTLTVNIWGASGYDDDGSVNYGKTGETLLEDRLKVTEAKNVTVTGYDTDDNEITLEDLNDDGDDDLEGTFEVTTDVDLYEGYLNRVTAWVNDDDEVIFLDVTSTYHIDAIEFDDDALDLVGMDKSFDINMDDAEVYVNGDLVADTTAEIEGLDGNSYQLAKVVLNSKNDVIYVDAYTFNQFVVAKSVDGDVVTTIDDEELDFEDYTIFKDGKLAAAADVVKGDIITFNVTEEFAEIYTESVTGAITELFDEVIEVEKEEYAFDGSLISVIHYLNEDDEFVPLTNDAAEQFEDEGKDVTVFLDRAGEALFITGDLGEAVTNTVAGILTEAASFDSPFGRATVEFTFINESDKKVTEVIKLADLDKVNGDDVDGASGDSVVEFESVADLDLENVLLTGKGTIVEFVYDEDGDVVELNFLSNTAIAPAIETGDKYVENKKVSSDTLVFIVDDLTDDIDTDTVTITKWGDLEFDDINSGTVYWNDDQEAKYIVTDDTSEEVDETDFTGLLVSFRTNTDGEVTRLTAWVDGVKKTYTVDTDVLGATLTEGFVYTLTVEDETGIVNDITGEIDTTSGEVLLTTSVSVSSRTFDTTTNPNADDYKLVSGATILQYTGSVDDIKVKAIRDLSTLVANNEVVVVLDEAGTRFVKLVIIIDNTN